MSDEPKATGVPEPESHSHVPVWRRMVASAEGKVFFLGLVILGMYVVGLLVVREHSVHEFNKLWTMTTTHMLAGRAAGLSLGYQQKFTPRVAIFCNMVIETFMVMIFYPLFVFSYHKLIVIKPLEDAMERARDAAETHRETVKKFGVPGLMAFVLMPFWMTGPLVGSVIGYIIGLKPWVNMTVVLSGTYLAILCWGIALRRIHDWLEAFGYYVPLAFVCLVVMVALFVHISYTFARRKPRASDSPEKQP